MASHSSSLTAIAERYATALYELADEARALDAIATDLRSLRQMLRDSADLQRFVASPAISRTDAGGVVAALAKAATFAPVTTRFLGVIAAKRRLRALPLIIEAFLTELARRRGEMTVSVVSATALSKDQLAALDTALRQAVGNKLVIETAVDDRLIGGLVVRVGSRLVDASVRGRLERLQYAMKGVA